MNFRTILAKNYVNFRGWKTAKKIVVIESDDWGSIRMPSRAIYDDLLADGIPVNSSYFTKNDCLESEEDLNELFKVLTSFQDKKGNHPVITANAVMANPNFEQIAASHLKEYSYELFTETYKHYKHDSKVFELWKSEGMGKRLLWPQFHGREHLNVKEWMTVLNANTKQENLGFEHKALLGIGNRLVSKRTNEYMSAFEYDSEEDLKQIDTITKDGLEIFEKIFGFKSKSFVASCAIRSEKLDEVLVENGVVYHQCGQYRKPDGKGAYETINRFWGDTNQYNQLYWRRNATFEPSRDPNFDWVNSCLKEMAIAFRWGKPAVINSHRVNYIGSIFEENRENGLRLLNELLKAMLEKWPDIEFFTSDQLGDFMVASKT